MWKATGLRGGRSWGLVWYRRVITDGRILSQPLIDKRHRQAIDTIDIERVNWAPNGARHAPKHYSDEKKLALSFEESRI